MRSSSHSDCPTIQTLNVGRSNWLIFATASSKMKGPSTVISESVSESHRRVLLLSHYRTDGLPEILPRLFVYVKVTITTYQIRYGINNVFTITAVYRILDPDRMLVHTSVHQ